MSFQIFTKKTRRIVGGVAAMLITGIIGFGFVNLYINIKNDQIEGNGIIEVKILAEKPIEPATLFEAVPTEQCIKKISHNAEEIAAANNSSQQQTPAPQVSAPQATAPQTSAPQTTASPPVNGLPPESATQSTQKVAVNKPSNSIKLIQPPDGRLIPAGLPSCLAQSAAPKGAEKLGADGFVALELRLAANGNVESGEIEATSGFDDLDAAALKQVALTWRFQPCKKAGVDVACSHRIRFRWATK